MTWPLTPEEQFNPLLLPPVTNEYPVAPGEVAYVVGAPDMNHWYDDGQGYAGPVTPVMQEQIPVFDRKLRFGRGKRPSAYQADYPQSFFPEVVDSYEAAMNRQPAGSYEDRMWEGSDARVDFTFAPRRSPNRYSGGISGLNENWYDTTSGKLGIAAGVGVLSYLLVGAFFSSRARD